MPAILPALVLILVLMEYGLWLKYLEFLANLLIVLILVLMEYGLWQEAGGASPVPYGVLILVLMEYGLWRQRLIIIIKELRAS